MPRLLVLSGLPGTGYQFTIRRANPKGVTPIVRRERKRDALPIEKLADTAQANNAFCLLDEVAEAAESEYVALQKVFDQQYIESHRE